MQFEAKTTPPSETVGTLPFVGSSQAANPQAERTVHDRLRRMTEGRGDFWTVVHEPFMNRELHREQVRELIASGLRETGGYYKELLSHFRLSTDQYPKFMDFLRHQQLKP